VSRCNRGGKAFCCKFTQFESLTEHCRWTENCGSDCKSDEAEVAYAWDRWGYATILCNGYEYCCKKKYPVPLSKCHWDGKGDCAQNMCATLEVTLWINMRGDTDDSGSCNWHRHKSLCCTPSADALEQSVCDTDICADDESLCDDSAGDAVSSVTRRALSVGDSGDDDIDDNESEYFGELDKTRPGEPREFAIKMAAAGTLV
jgi:chitinase